MVSPLFEHQKKALWWMMEQERQETVKERFERKLRDEPSADPTSFQMGLFRYSERPGHGACGNFDVILDWSSRVF